MDIVQLIIGGLAVWRISHGLVKQNGPLMAFARLRAYLAKKQKRSGGLFDMVSCVSCASMFIALVAALGPSYSFATWLMYTLALSAVATLLEGLYVRLETK